MEGGRVLKGERGEERRGVLEFKRKKGLRKRKGEKGEEREVLERRAKGKERKNRF